MIRKLLKFFHQMEDMTKKDTEGRDMATWAENLKPCANPEVFTGEAQWVIFCSGISYKAARSMQNCYLRTGECRHPHKEKAVRSWEMNGHGWWEWYQKIDNEKDKLAFLRTLPYMGGKALVYQLAKNLGITGYCKPDVHLLRLADRFGYPDPQKMCEEISGHTGKTVAYVDTILWFSAAQRWAYNPIYEDQS